MKACSILVMNPVPMRVAASSSQRVRPSSIARTVAHVAPSSKSTSSESGLS
jgi:hypothetical protein